MSRIVPEKVEQEVCRKYSGPFKESLKHLLLKKQLSNCLDEL